MKSSTELSKTPLSESRRVINEPFDVKNNLIETDIFQVGNLHECESIKFYGISEITDTCLSKQSYSIKITLIHAIGNILTPALYNLSCFLNIKILNSY